MAEQNSSRRDIQFLRAFAVLAVIAYHFQIAGFVGGFVGVDIFFVISGYLIFGKVYAQMQRGDFSLKRFFGARIRRIFPALAVVCAATALWGWFFILPREYLSFSRTALASLTFVSNHAFMGPQGYFDAASHTKPLLHTWSLAVEGQFYFWLPLILIAVYKARFGTRVPLLLALAGAVSFAWALWLAYKMPESGFYHVAARGWEFAAGAACAIIAPSRHRHARLFLLVSLIALVASVSLLGGSAPWPNLWALLPVGFAAAFIYFAADAQDHPVIAHPSVQLVGDMSYSLYLWHWPVWVFAGMMYGDGMTIAHKAVMLLLIFLFAYVSWRWVERPFRERGRVSSSRLKVATVAVLLAGLSFTAFVVATKGYPARFPEYVARAAIQAAQTTPRNECFRSDRNTKDAPEQFCVYGASARARDATTMLWGDSHANQYLSALSDASKVVGSTGLIATMGGCRAFIESDAVQYPDYPFCKAFNREVYAYLLDHPRIETVILARIWFDDDEAIGRTVKLVRELIAHGRKVILLTPLPVPGMNVETGWAVRQIQAGHAIDEIKLEATPEVRQSAILDKLRAELKIEAESGKLWLLDPTRRLCDASHCYIVRDGLASFRDTSHLTEPAAQTFEPDFIEALRRMGAAK